MPWYKKASPPGPDCKSNHQFYFVLTVVPKQVPVQWLPTTNDKRVVHGEWRGGLAFGPRIAVLQSHLA